MQVVAKFNSRVRAVPQLTAPEVARTAPNVRYEVKQTRLLAGGFWVELEGLGWVPRSFRGVQVFRCSRL